MGFKVRNDLPTKAQHEDPKVLCLQLIACISTARINMQKLLIRSGHKPLDCISYVAGMFEAIEQRAKQLTARYTKEGLEHEK